jgi:alkylation response protein AidB-like acyl-CoA dehydrogenase
LQEFKVSYQAPIEEQVFVLETVAELCSLAHYPKFSELDETTAKAVLEGGAHLATDIFAPLNRLGDTLGAKWTPEGVKHPIGFAQAYVSFIEGGWGGLSADPGYGGQGLPFCVSVAFSEQLASANLAFSTCMLLSSGAIEAISAHGSQEQKELYLPQLISGEWSGTMNLTEPQAGSDVGALRTTATPASDGSWRIKGSKIFITWGEHELSKNIIHLVLARTPGAPTGTKGLSLFLVPKFLPNKSALDAVRNDLRCVSIENKLGIHASPTCTMIYGENDRCIGWLLGAENAGMRAMFTMMNAARINVGIQGVAIAERAYQGALAYARERVQSAPVTGGKAPVRIIEHPDVRRMLMTMRASTEAVRAIAYFNAAAIDRSRAEKDESLKANARGLADLLTPITKALATDIGVEIASLGIQVFGGVGFIEDTGAAQHYRDIRIAPIYEGTNGIQAIDLIGRKLHADGGTHWRRLLDQLECAVAALTIEGFESIRDALTGYLSMLRARCRYVQALDVESAAAIASPFLRLFGLVLGGALLAKQAGAAAQKLAKGDANRKFLTAKIVTTRFFIDEILPQALGLDTAIGRCSLERLFGLNEEQMAR